jgi:hypothetical protein
MKRTIVVAAMSMSMAAGALLGACGGGGGNPGGGASVVPPTVTPGQGLAGYVGTWAADCAGHARETDVITQLSDGTISIAPRTDYYAGDNCSGFVVATQTASVPITVTTTGTADVSVTLPPATTPVAVRIDLVTATTGPNTLSVSGTGVTRTTSNGKPAWRVDYGAGSAQTILDEGVQPGSSTNGALYVNGNGLYELAGSALAWTVGQHLVKQ